MSTAVRLIATVVATSIFLFVMSGCAESGPRAEASHEEKPKTLADKIDAEISGILPWFFAQQQENGAFIKNDRLAIKVTALAIEALVAPPQALATNDPRLQKAIAFLLSKQQADGCFHVAGGGGGFRGYRHRVGIAGVEQGEGSFT